MKTFLTSDCTPEKELDFGTEYSKVYKEGMRLFQEQSVEALSTLRYLWFMLAKANDISEEASDISCSLR